jgi:tetratricopeptide (TPR) repeat protein
MSSNILLTLRASAIWLYKNLSLKQTETHLGLIVSLLVRVAGLILLVFAGMLIWRLFKSDEYSLEAFAVPKQLDENGYSGVYLAQSVQDALLNLKKEAGQAKTDSLHVGNAADSDINVNVMGLDLSIKTIAHQIKQLFGRPAKTIRGEMTQSGNELHMVLRVSQFEPIFLHQPIENNLHNAVQKITTQAAESLLELTDPYRLAVVCYRSKRFDQSIALVRKIIKERPHERVWAYLAWASVLEEQKQVDMALSKYQRAVELDSTSAFAWRRWGACLNRQKDYQNAVLKFEKSLQLQPDNPNLWNQLATLYAEQNRSADSHAALQKAIEYAKNEPIVYINAAQIKLQLNCPEDARQFAQKAADIAGESADGYLAKVFISYIDKDTQAMINNGLYASELDPKNFANSYMAMSAAALQNNFVKVIEIGANLDFKGIPPEYQLLTYNYIATAYNFINKRDSAMAFVNRAFAIDSSFSYTYATLGEIFALNGRKDLFYKNLEKALQMGMPPTLEFSHEPYKSEKDAPQMKALLAKYAQ